MDDDPSQAEQDGHTGAPQRSLGADFRSRLGSGLLIGAVALLLTWLGVMPFSALVGAAALAISWEWGRIVRARDFDLTFAVHAIAVLIASGLAALGYVALGAAVLLTGAIIVLSLEFGDHPILSALGVFYAGLPAIALIWIRSDPTMGFMAVLLLILVVGATDTAAMVTGKSAGGPKLAPRLSPNKTWSGLAGGVLAAAATAALFALVAELPVAPLALTGLVLGFLAQGGDLAESALKRRFGVKDASNLIPGHGGVMDRLDGLAAAAVAAALLALYTNPQAPAVALFAGI